MSLSRVNADVTPYNREQTKQICGLKRWGYNPNYSPRPHAFELQGWDKTSPPKTVDLPNGSFSLDQVVGMLEAEGAELCVSPSTGLGRWFWIDAIPQTKPCGGSMCDQPCCGHSDIRLSKEAHKLFDLTAAMDALIEVLEAKK